MSWHTSPVLTPCLCTLDSRDVQGTADAPRCGFGRTVVEELSKLNAPVQTVDILQV